MSNKNLSLPVLFSALCLGALIFTPAHAMRGMNLFGNDVTEVKCRVCHEKRFNKGDSPLAEWLEMRNPDKHHLKVGTEVKCTTGPPGATLGDVYDCTSCHRFVWDAESVSYRFDVFRDCLYCHPENTVTGPPMRNRHPMMGRPCRVCHGITIYDDGTYDYAGGGRMGGGGMGGGRMGGGGMRGGGMGGGGMRGGGMGGGGCR